MYGYASSMISVEKRDQHGECECVVYVAVKPRIERSTLGHD
jgi:hypothetical protein